MILMQNNKIFLLFVVFFISNVHSKNYQFQAIYECEDNEFEPIEEEHTKTVNYICKRWIQKVKIIEAKNTYIRFQSKIREQQEEIEEEQQKDQQQQQQEQEERQKEEKQKRKQERKQKIKQIEEEKKRKRQQNNKQHPHQSKHIDESKYTNESQSRTNSIPSDSQIFPLAQKQQQNIDSKKQDGLKQQKKAHKSALYEATELSATQSETYLHPIHKNIVRDQQTQQGIKNLLPSHLKLPNDPRFMDASNCIQHNFVRVRHWEEEQDEEEEEDKFKPLKSHRSHPIDDVLFIFQFIQMSNVILEQAYQKAPKNNKEKPNKNLQLPPSKETQNQQLPEKTKSLQLISQTKSSDESHSKNHRFQYLRNQLHTNEKYSPLTTDFN